MGLEIGDTVLVSANTYVTPMFLYRNRTMAQIISPVSTGWSEVKFFF
jgi:hypothetical protein